MNELEWNELTRERVLRRDRDVKWQRVDILRRTAPTTNNIAIHSSALVTCPTADRTVKMCSTSGRGMMRCRLRSCVGLHRCQLSAWLHYLNGAVITSTTNPATSTALCTDDQLITSLRETRLRDQLE